MVWPKSVGVVPLRTMLVIVSVALPVVESVTEWEALVVLSSRRPKRSLRDLSLNACSAQVPDRLAVCGLPLALSVTASVAARALVAVGVNVTLMVQLVLAARDRESVV